MGMDVEMDKAARTHGASIAYRHLWSSMRYSWQAFEKGENRCVALSSGKSMAWGLICLSVSKGRDTKSFSQANNGRRNQMKVSSWVSSCIAAPSRIDISC